MDGRGNRWRRKGKTVLEVTKDVMEKKDAGEMTDEMREQKLV